MITSSRVILKFVFVGLMAVITNSQSGGQFVINPSVIASGGGTSSGGQFTVQGTTGQAAAGTRMATVPFRQTGGFWDPVPLVPTAANVSISGRVTTTKGLGIPAAVLTLADLNGLTRTEVTNTLGVYQFNDVTAGSSYVLSAASKGYTFPPPQIISVSDSITDVNFVGDTGRRRSRASGLSSKP